MEEKMTTIPKSWMEEIKLEAMRLLAMQKKEVPEEYLQPCS